MSKGTISRPEARKRLETAETQPTVDPLLKARDLAEELAKLYFVYWDSLPDSVKQFGNGRGFDFNFHRGQGESLHRVAIALHDFRAERVTKQV